MPMPRNCDAHMPGAGAGAACCAPRGLLSPTLAIEEPVDIVLPRFGGGGGGSPFPFDSSFPSAECADVSGGGGGAGAPRPDIATDGTRESIAAGIRGSPPTPFIVVGTFGTKRPLAEAARLKGGAGGGGGGGGALCESGRFGADRRRGAAAEPLPPPLPFEWLEVEAAPFPPNEALPPASPLLPPALFRFLDELDLDGDESTIWFSAAVSKSSPEPDDAPASDPSPDLPRLLRLVDIALPHGEHARLSRQQAGNTNRPPRKKKRLQVGAAQDERRTFPPRTRSETTTNATP